MIRLLFGLIFAEMFLILAFVFKNPLRKLVIMTLDRVQRGRGPVVVNTVAGTLLVVMMTSLCNVVAIHWRWDQDGEVNPADQILLAKHLVEASLTGFSLFLALIIDRLHHYIRELRIRRKSMETGKPQNRVVEDGKPSVLEETKTFEKEMSSLRGRTKQLEMQLEEKIKETSSVEGRIKKLEMQLEEKTKETSLAERRIKKLEIQLEEKTKEASNAEANAVALKKQSEGFLLEYDRLLEENQNLHSQLQSIDRMWSLSESKKVV